MKRSLWGIGALAVGVIAGLVTVTSNWRHPPSPTPSPVRTALASPASAATGLIGNYYVSPTGNDSNTGTQSTPFRTLQRAASMATAGQIVVAECGVYYFTSTYAVSLTASGVAGKPIRFVSASPKCAVLDGSNFTSGYAFSLNANGEGYINIEGFEIQHFLHAGIWLNAGSNGLADGSHDVVVFGNHIHNIGNVTTTSAYGIVGIGTAQGTRNVTIEGNEIDHIGRLGGKGAADHGLYIGGGDYTITANYFHDNNEGWDIQIAGHHGDLDTGYLISGNTFGAHANVGGASNPGNIVAWANTGKTPAGSLTNNAFAPNGGHSPLHCYPKAAVGSPAWIIGGNTVPTGIALTDCLGLTLP